MKNNQTEIKVARGGKRVGAGRKAGTPNKATAARQKRVASTGVTPLDIMIDNMRSSYADTQSAMRRLKTAKTPAKQAELKAEVRQLRGETNKFAVEAAPYVHPKLQSVMHATDPDNVIRVVHSVDQESLMRAAAFIRGPVAPVVAPAKPALPKKA